MGKLDQRTDEGALPRPPCAVKGRDRRVAQRNQKSRGDATVKHGHEGTPVDYLQPLAG